MNPRDYVKKFHTVNVPIFLEIRNEDFYIYGSLPVTTPVKEYLNIKYYNKAGKSPQSRIRFKDKLLRFFKARSNSKEQYSGISYSGGGYKLLNSIQPIKHFPKIYFMRCFGGKGNPEMLKDIIQFISYYVSYKKYVEKVKPFVNYREVGPVLIKLVKEYLGVDCNSFVGNFLLSKYPIVRNYNIGPQTPEKYFKTQAKIRRKLEEINDEDVLIFRHKFSKRCVHVAIIDRIDGSDFDNKGNLTFIACNVCESRSRLYGGPQCNICLIRQKGGRFIISGIRKDLELDSIVKVKGTPL